ncbi:hypothetical protein RSOLAG22IIIB_04850 [Rhizoctonia solani]|uniref:Uncharacterized protein n=1 Tax=Rhizoctonia solani TaxID=456999 RepID=A0A0K6G0E3_9AGAM|nr:hypothetical protein RSOLAG22IIIB_04850 [Rhizoctonia solani]
MIFSKSMLVMKIINRPRFVQDVLNQPITKIIKLKSAFAKGFEALGFSISSLPKSLDRESALAFLPQVCCHEDAVTLQGHGSVVHPDASSFRGSIVKFKSLGELRDALACNSSVAKEELESARAAVEMGAQDSKRESISHKAEPRATYMLPGAHVRSSATSKEPSESSLPEPDGVALGSRTIPLEEPAEVRPSESETCHSPPMAPPPRPDTPASIADSEEDIVPLGNAALVVFGAWRRSTERIAQRERLSKFNQIGQLFEQYRQCFPKLGPKAPIRDKRALHLIRGPCINIVLGLRLLIKEIEVYEGTLNKEQTSEAAPSQVENTQDGIENRRRKAE